MKEITRIITAQITEIARIEDVEDIPTKERSAEKLREVLEDNFGGLDDVVITVQDFEMDVE